MGAGEFKRRAGVYGRWHEVVVYYYIIRIRAAIGGIGDQQGIGTWLVHHGGRAAGAAHDIAIGGSPLQGEVCASGVSGRADHAGRQAAIDQSVRAGQRIGGQDVLVYRDGLAVGAAVGGVDNVQGVHTRLIHRQVRRSLSAHDAGARPGEVIGRSLCGCGSVDNGLQRYAGQDGRVGDQRIGCCSIVLHQGAGGGGTSVLGIGHQQGVGTCQVYGGVQRVATAYDIAIGSAPLVGEVGSGRGRAIEHHGRCHAVERGGGACIGQWRHDVLWYDDRQGGGALVVVIYQQQLVGAWGIHCGLQGSLTSDDAWAGPCIVE